MTRYPTHAFPLLTAAVAGILLVAGSLAIASSLSADDYYSQIGCNTRFGYGIDIPGNTNPHCPEVIPPQGTFADCAASQFVAGSGRTFCEEDPALSTENYAPPRKPTPTPSLRKPLATPTPAPRILSPSSPATQSFTRCESPLIMKVGDSHDITSRQKVTFTLADVGAASGTFTIAMAGKQLCQAYEPACTYYQGKSSIENLALTSQTLVQATIASVETGESVIIRFCT